VPNLAQVFLQAAVVGFAIAAPVGPIGVLCIRRTLANGRIAGLVSGLGAATADATYGGIAGFGVTFLSTLLVSQQIPIRLLGGAFLLLLGVRTFLSVPGDPHRKPEGNLASDYLSTFALTLSNPVTIVAFAAIFAGLGVTGQDVDYTAGALLVSGVFAGSALWWVILSSVISSFRDAFDLDRLRWVNRISGLVIAGFGATTLLTILI
jgi:threonine/homoserine/homoserine lactone efflux protein